MISDITNGELGSSVRAKLNQAIAEINGLPAQLAEKLNIANFDWANLQNKPSTFPSDSAGWNVAHATETSKQNSTALSAITGLGFDILDFVPTFFEVQIWLFIQGTAGSSGCKWSASAPSGSLGAVSLQSSQASNPIHAAINATTAAFPAAASMPTTLALFGVAKFLVIDDGSFSLNFAQNTSSPNAITVLPESRIEWRKLS